MNKVAIWAKVLSGNVEDRLLSSKELDLMPEKGELYRRTSEVLATITADIKELKIILRRTASFKKQLLGFFFPPEEGVNYWRAIDLDKIIADKSIIRKIDKAINELGALKSTIGEIDEIRKNNNFKRRKRR